MTKNVGTPGVLYFVMNCALLPFSMSTESQTNRPAYRASDASVKTYARIDRQVCHQGAHASAKMGTCSDSARATAFASSSSIAGNTTLATTGQARGYTN